LRKSNQIYKNITKNGEDALKYLEKYVELDNLQCEIYKNKNKNKDNDDANLKSSKDDFLPQKKSKAFCSDNDK
jgi:hypothetical protein